LEHVAHGRAEVLLVPDHPRPVPLFEEVALAFVAAIEALRIEAEHAVHHPTQLRRRRRLDDHVEVRPENRVRQELDSEHLRGAVEQHDEGVAVNVVEEYEHAARPSRTDVKPARREETARCARHASDRRGALASAPAVVTVSLQGLSLGLGR
jgi:hypothetical protein